MLIHQRENPTSMSAPVQSLVLPDDEPNRRLVANVHPSGWVNPEPAGRYNMVVVGAGTAGLITAVVAAGLGAKVALIERHLMGGDCLNVGCVPSKALIRAAHAWAQLRDASAFGLHIPPGVTRDFGAVMAFVLEVRKRSGHVRTCNMDEFVRFGADVIRLGEFAEVHDDLVGALDSLRSS